MAARRFTKLPAGGPVRRAATRSPTVTLDNMIAYVKSPYLNSPTTRKPTAAQDEILPYTSLPLTRTK